VNKCLICNEILSLVTSAHLKKHNITKEAYLRKYRNISLASDEWKERNSNSHIGQIAWNKGLNKETNETVAQYSESLHLHQRSKSHSQHISQAKKGNPLAIAGWNKGLTKETNKSMAKLANNKERSEAISKALKGRIITWGDKISQVKIEQFKDKVFSDRMVMNITRHAWEVSPNKPEKLMLDLLEELCPGEWDYVGNSGLVLGRLIPDFAHRYGKLLIEIFGDYWHKDTNIQKRIDHFMRYGYSTLIIWEHEIKNTPDLVEEKVANFLSVETIHEPSRDVMDEDKVRHSLKEEINNNA